MKKKNVMIIGTGGIGSYLVPLLNQVDLYNITAYDSDIVEIKNLTYQNFTKSDVGKKKVLALGERYNIDAQPYLVLTESQIQDYDLVICCADNLDVRRLVYNSDVAWLDLRAQGRMGLLVCYKEDKKMYSTLTAGPDGSFSCQGDSWDESSAGVHFTHVAVAGYGAEWVQRYFNGEDVHKHIQVSA